MGPSGKGSVWSPLGLLGLFFMSNYMYYDHNVHVKHAFF